MEIKSKNSPQNSLNDTNAKEKQLKDVASLYEKQFLREMVKQMRSTVNENDVVPASFAEKYYREQLDHQYVESWGDQGGIGLGKLIYDQLLDRYGAQLGIKLPKENVKGPLPLTQKDQWVGEFQPKNKSIEFRKKDNLIVNNESLSSPWNGKWMGSFELENGLTAVRIDHGESQSLLVGSFNVPKRSIGSPISAGEDFLTLQPISNKFLWKIENKIKEENL